MGSHTLIADGVWYGSQGDERAFFGWLQSIDCVSSLAGAGAELTISVSGTPTDDELREFIALFARYNVDMRQLAVFLSKSNEHWFHEVQAFWFARVFG